MAAPFTSTRSHGWTYLLAVIVTVATLGGRLVFASWFAGRPALVLFVLPIFLSAYVGGLGPGLVSTAVFALGSAYFLMSPIHSFAMDNSVDAVLWVVLILIGVVISVLTESLHAVRRREDTVAVAQRGLGTERQVQAAFGLALVFLIVIGAVSVVSVNRLREDTGWATHTQEVIASLRLLHSTVTEAETGVRGYLITGEKTYLEPYDGARRVIDGEMQNLRKLTADNAVQQHQLDLLMPLVADRMAQAQQNVLLRHRQPLTAPEIALAINGGESLHDRIRTLIAEMEATEQGLLHDREARARQVSLVTRTVIIVGGTLAFVFVAVALFVMKQGFALRRRTEGALREARNQLEVRVRERTAELEHANGALQTSEARYHTLFDYAPDGIVIADTESRYLDANASICRMLGYTRDELIGLHATDIVTVTEAPHVEPALSAIRLKSDYHRVWQFRRKDNSTFAAEVLATQMPDGNLLGVIRDITDRNKAEQALRESEEIFSKAFRHSPDCLAIVRMPDRTVIRANEAVCHLWGSTPEEVIGKPTREYTNWVNEEERFAFMQTLQEKGENLNHETDLRMNDGRLVRFNLSSRMISVEGQSCILSVMSDITERKRAEIAAARLAAIVEFSDDAIIGKDLHGIVTSWNAAAERTFGYPAAEMVGQSITKLIPPERQYEEAEIFARILLGENVSHMETVRVRQDGRRIDVSVTVSAIRDPQGNITGASKVARDITGRKQAERRLGMRNAVSRVLADATSLAQATPGIIRAICEAERWDFGSIWEVDAAARVLCCRDIWHSLDFQGEALVAQTRGLTLASGEGLPGRVWASGKMHLIPDVELDPGYMRAKTATAAGLHSAMAIPIFVGSEVTGVMDFSAREIRQPEEQLIEMFTAIGRQVGQFVERQRAEEALRASQARLNSTLAAGSIGTWTWDIGKDRLIADEFIARMFSVEVDAAAQGLPAAAYLQAVIEEDQPAVSEALARAIQSCGRYDIEYQVRQKDGRLRWLQAKGRVEGDAAGQARHFHGAVLDITGRKLAEAAVHESEEYFHFLNDLAVATRTLADPRQIMAVTARMLGGHLHASRCAYADVAPDGEQFTIRHDYTDGCASTVGDYQLSLFGARAVATLQSGRTLIIRNVQTELLPEEGADTFNAIGIQAIITCPLVKEGRLRAMMAVHQTTPRDWKPGEITIVQDVVERCWVTIERRNAEEKIRQLNAELEQRVIERTAQLETANQELEAFSYSVSHDLRTPLRAVDGFSQAVLEDYGPALPAEGFRYLQTIRESAQRMGELIDDLLAFSRLSRQPLQQQPVDTEQLVRSALTDLRLHEAGRQIEIKTGPLPPCQGDPALLKQVWINLLSNAFKYTRRRQETVVEIGCTKQDGAQVFFVRDNGTGFDMQYAHKLFGVFQRLHRVEDYEGTGVGLAIVQRIIHRHGGKVWAEAAPDAGATFFFTLQGANPS